MLAEKLSMLLRRPEGETLDFKLEAYDIATDYGKAALVKDVVSMANTPREGDACIVFGVKELGNGKVQPVGMSRVPDDATLQEIVASAVNPAPRFHFEPVVHEGKVFGILTIIDGRHGPFITNKEFGKEALRKGVVYYRRGSRNTEADADALRRIITWMEAGKVEPVRGLEAEMEASWERFLDEVHHFKSDYRYLLVAPPLDKERIRSLQGLGVPSWHAVLDLDPMSEWHGLLSVVEKKLVGSRSLYRVTPDDPDMVLGGHNTLQWIFAKGLSSNSITLHSMTYKQWNTRYSHGLRSHLTRLTAALRPAPVICVVLGYDPANLLIINSILDAASGTLGESLKLVVATDDISAYSRLADQFEAPLIAIPLEQLCIGLAQLSLASAENPPSRILPSVSGAPIPLDPVDAPWIEEELEVLYLDAGYEPVGDDRMMFLKGEEISWYALSRRVDIDRSRASRLRSIVERELDRGGRATRINLYHTAGAGGSTVARRVVWDLHELYPSATLKGNPSVQAINKWAEENADRLMRLAHAAQRPVLLLADSSRVPERMLDELYDTLRSRQVNAVILQVMRRFAVTQEAERVVQLPAFLTDDEAERFLEVYTEARPERSRDLELLSASRSRRERVPFYFGLTAFGKDFRGLENYVATRVKKIEQTEQDILCYIALAHYYGQQGVSAQLFADLLGVPAWKPVDFAKKLQDPMLDLLVEQEPGVWRPAHALFSEEILRHLLGADLTNKEDWQTRLPDKAIEFAHLCREGSSIVGDRELDLIQRIFIYRDSSELLGTERASSRSFAQIIEDIKLPNAAVRVLRTLADLFPEEPHFHAHLARYQAFRMRDLKEAKRSILKALSQSDRDSVLYHMSGMIHRQVVYELLRDQVNLEKVVEAAQEASESFAEARRLRSDNEHGYISEVQMLLRLADYARQRQGQRSGPILTITGYNLVDNALELVEDLLAQVRQLHLGEEPSRYELDCRAKLEALYGNHEEALRAYHVLLERPGVDHPSIRRQLVWTYLRKQERRWHDIKPKDIRRIERLLRDNLREGAGDDRTMRLWIQAARFLSPPPDIDELIEQISLWRSINPSLEATYYLYVVNTLKYLDSDSRLAREEAERLKEECRHRAQYRTDRTKSIEWFGSGCGVSRLVHQSRLGVWNPERRFFMNAACLERVEGRVTNYSSPQAGWIEVEGLQVFYVPGVAGHHRRSLHQRVSCYLGFAYEGLRAWEVQDL
ncbi:RNA-binding domain-containing protein [Microbispora sp. NBC_01389]|uniref:RNA-binding domain-containing protein n=1 Tax=Microbispora sp. NBC_01389 TaxID=2903584 RepID=UPI003254019C